MLEKILEQCPCGKTPTALSIEPSASGHNFAWVLGNCCGEWAIEFITNNSEDKEQAAIAAWNVATRNDRENT